MAGAKSKGWCDSCAKETKVKRLNIGGGAAIFLYRPCWSREMAWRRERNKELRKSERFPMIKW